jgi:hypothetical protein
MTLGITMVNITRADVKARPPKCPNVTITEYLLSVQAVPGTRRTGFGILFQIRPNECVCGERKVGKQNPMTVPPTSKGKAKQLVLFDSPPPSKRRGKS